MSETKGTVDWRIERRLFSPGASFSSAPIHVVGKGNTHGPTCQPFVPSRVVAKTTITPKKDQIFPHIYSPAQQYWHPPFHSALRNRYFKEIRYGCDPPPVASRSIILPRGMTEWSTLNVTASLVSRETPTLTQICMFRFSSALKNPLPGVGINHVICIIGV